MRDAPYFNHLYFVRKFDYENFLSTLLIKDSLVKRSAFAFRAFNVELSQVLDVSSQPVAIQGRYLFWNQIIDEIYSGNAIKNVGSNPIISELNQVSS